MNNNISNEIILSVQGLKKSYGKNLIIDNTSFELERGKIYGFIGQNGAGKTTIIRMIAGYAKPDEGTISIFGDSSNEGLSAARKRIGLIVENPALYLKMSAYENIEIQKTLYGVKDDKLAQNLLNFVGLSDVGNRNVKDFSLGMRQRLGIAMALVNDPEILILDEPINGLDPVGILEVRELLLKLNKERNITILISSHILSELYQLATDYIIINKGQIVEKLTLAELDGKCTSSIVIQTEDIEGAKSVLRKLNIPNIEEGQNGFIRFLNENIDVREVAKSFMDEKILLTHFSVQTEGLESYFVRVIGGEYHGEAV